MEPLRIGHRIQSTALQHGRATNDRSQPRLDHRPSAAAGLELTPDFSLF